MSLFCSILRRSCFCHPLRLLIQPYAQGHANFSCPKNFKLIRQTAVSFCYRHLSEFSPVFSCPVTRPNGAEPDVIQVLLRQKTGRLRRLKPCQEFHPNSIVVKYRNSQEFWLSIDSGTFIRFRESCRKINCKNVTLRTLIRFIDDNINR